MRRLAELQSLRRSIAIALTATTGLAVSRLTDRCDRGHSSASAPTTPIHIKYRPGHVGRLAAFGAVARPLFTHVRSMAAYDDPRTRWMRIEVPDDQASGVLARLAADSTVEQAFVPPTVTLPTEMARPLAAADDSCPITTPSFESHQGYLGPAPFGIDAPAAWRRGVLGQGVWFADIEGGWNAKHEDLPTDRIAHAGGQLITDPSWRAHGTAVLGEVVGRDNGKGVVGIAPEVERVFTSSIGGTSVADAIDTAAQSLRPGDVLLIELQGGGPRGRYLPVEYWDDNFDAIEAATQRGIIVIEAAGNGAENLDHRAYGGKLSRGTRDSGAIMIGAGGPPRDGFKDRTRLDFSNWGTRVDVQGWGRMVATLDYGDLQKCAGADRHYTGLFSGTSSASPIVAGAAVLLQSYAKQKGRTLAPDEVRRILRETGSPQTGNTKEQIGPRPDLARALPALP
jgi:subtilisin family serine protease